MGLIAVLTTLILGIYFNSFNAFRRGTTRLEAQQRVREVLRRVAPLIMSAKAPSPAEPAVLVPPVGTVSSVLEFHSADDLSSPLAPLDPRAPVHYVFRIWHEAGDGSVRFTKLNGPGGAPNSEQRILAHRVERFDAECLAINLVRITAVVAVQLKTAIRADDQIAVERSSVISIPYYSSAR